MTINVELDENAIFPTKAHDADAGFDLCTPERVVLHRDDSVLVDTGVHFEIPQGYVGMLKSKSGLNCKHGIVSEGVIDAGYTGSVCVKLYNHSEERYVFNAGDKITQIVFLPIPQVKLGVVERVSGLDRGDSGFGSTGK